MICQCFADQLFASAFGFGKYIDLLATDKSRYFAQPHPIIVNWLPIEDIWEFTKPRRQRQRQRERR